MHRELLKRNHTACYKFIGKKEIDSLLEKAGITTPPAHLACSLEEAVKAADNMGYPVALKAYSPKILHKSDIGGVVLNIHSREALSRAYHDIKDRTLTLDPPAEVLVQKMVPSGVEVIVGMVKTPDFGQVLMFGLGGIFTEVLEDVTFRLIPIQLEDAADMISSVKGYPLLRGARGIPPVDEPALMDFLVRVADLCRRHPSICEMDLNPVIIHRDRITVVDARIAVE